VVPAADDGTSLPVVGFLSVSSGRARRYRTRPGADPPDGRGVFRSGPSRTGHNHGMDRVIGIVGGTGPESTADYYRTFIRLWRDRGPEGTYPRVMINSVEGGHVIGLLGRGDYLGVATELSAAVGQLAAAGVGAAILASNACHLAFDEINRASPIPLIHIVHATRVQAQQRGHRRVGLIGTRFVMQSGLYPEPFAKAGIDVVVPTDEEQDFVHAKYLGELVPGTILDATRDALVDIISTMRDRDAIDGMILGGTELALILTKPSYANVPMLNTTSIHVEAAIDWLLDTGGLV
jgi:aspartate racemase